MREAVRVYDFARKQIGEANRTHTAAVVKLGQIIIPARPFTAERIRENKRLAFRTFNQRRAQLLAARRRLDARPASRARARRARSRRRAVRVMISRPRCPHWGPCPCRRSPGNTARSPSSDAETRYLSIYRAVPPLSDGPGARRAPCCRPPWRDARAARRAVTKA